MKLLLLLNGNKDLIISSNNIEFDEIIKIDEKDLVNFKKINKLIKSINPNELYFGVKDLEFQRFIFFLKLYFLFTFNKGAILDENGIKDNYSFLKLILKEKPLLIYELFSSALIVLYFYIKMPILKWIIYSKK